MFKLSKRNRWIVCSLWAIVFGFLLVKYGLYPKTTLYLTGWINNEEKQALENQLLEFSRQNRTLKVQLIALDPAKDVHSKIDSFSKQNKASDVLMIQSGDITPWIESKLICDLRSYHPDDSSFLSETVSVFSQGTELYALPYGWSTLVLYCNRTLFERHGVPIPRSFWDWGDLLHAAQSLTIFDKNLSEITQYGLEIKPSMEVCASFIWQNRGELKNADGKWSLIDPQFLQSNAQAIEFLADLIREYHVAPSPEKLSKTNLFLSQKAAMTIAHRNLSYILNQQNHFDWDIAPLPRGRQGATWLDVYGYAISSQSKHPKEAWKLISFLTGETSQAAMILQGHYAPSRRSLLVSKIFTEFPGPRAARNSAFTVSLSFANLSPSISYGKQASKIFEEEMIQWISNEKKSGRTILKQIQIRLDELNLLHESASSPNQN